MNGTFSWKLRAFLTLLTVSTVGCGLVDHQEASPDTSAPSNSNAVLSIAPYQNSALTLVSPDGKNTKAATFQKFTGELTMKKDAPSSVKFAVQTNSMATSDKKLIGVLQDKDFFNAEKFPVAQFQSTEIKKNTAAGAQPNSYLVDGDLDIRGQKIKMTVPASMDVTEKEVSMMIQLSITHKDWMDKMSTTPDAFFKDHMDVVAKLVFPKPVKEVPAPASTPAPAEIKKTPVVVQKTKNESAPKEQKAEPAKVLEKAPNPKKGK